MATKKQIEAAKENIKKAQKAWQEMSHEKKAAAQPEGRDRKDPGEGQEGDYFRIVVRPKSEFTTFRYHDVGDPGHIIRLAGKRRTGTWDTHAWLISKRDAHVEGESLIPDTKDARELFESLASKPKHVEGDIFESKERS